MPLHRTTILLALLLATPPPAAPQLFSEITDAERALTEVPDHPGAPAVVLFKRAELRLRDTWAGTPSILEVHVRLKILTENGKGFGQVTVGHGAGVELERFGGRTVTPDGRTVTLAAGDIFREERSRVRQSFATKAAFPAVEVGAILDYRYRLRWSSVFLEPWTFDEPIPTLLSEIIYHQPFGMTVEHTPRGPATILAQSDRTARGTVVRIWAENLPPVVEEPYGPPYAELANQVMIVPRTDTATDGTAVRLLDAWTTVCANFEEKSYGPLRRKARQVRKTASSVASRAGREKTARISALHAFVRDEVRTTESGIRVHAKSLDDVLAAKHGTYAEKALLLQALLQAVKIPSRLVWAIDWREGYADLDVVNPGWFEKVLVRVDEDGPLYLDPGEPVAAGRLAPTNEGTEALIVDAERPEVVELPAAPAAASRRRAVMELTVDDDGGVGGSGRMTLDGHHAWFYLGLSESAEASGAGWRQWLANRFEGFDVSGVSVERSPDEQRLEISWALRMADEVVLGDEVSLRPSRPLGPLRQRYTIPPELRKTPVQVSFADVDELELVLSWPEGWEVDLVPEAVDHASDAGRASATFEHDEAARRLVYRRSIEIAHTRYAPGEPYARLRQLYSVMERHDAASLVLYRND